MSEPRAVGVDAALDELVHQFGDSMAFVRELVQNSLDAGSNEIEIRVDFEPDEKSVEGPMQPGAMIVHVDDWGIGMDRKIIDARLTRLFSSAKDGDRTKIGKFGIGFVSVFSMDPDAVCVDTSRDGEHWRVLFDRERNFKRIRRDVPGEGTKIRIIKSVNRAQYVENAKQVRRALRFWCRHAPGDIRFEGQPVFEPFEIQDALVAVERKTDTAHYVVAHSAGNRPTQGFFNRGLTLLEAGLTDPPVPELAGLDIKVSSSRLEHTLSRDDIIRDDAFETVVAQVSELAFEELGHAVFHAHAEALREGFGGGRHVQLVGALRWHLARGEWPRRLATLPMVRSPAGREFSFGELDLAGQRGEPIYVCGARSTLSDRVEAAGAIVIEAPEQLVQLRNAVQDLTKSELMWVQEGFATARAVENERRFAALGEALCGLLDATSTPVREVRFGHFRSAGSSIGRRLALSQGAFEEATPLAEGDSLDHGLFAPRRVLVIDADHDFILQAARLASREPELAAYQVLRMFHVAKGSCDLAMDTRLIGAAHSLRCRRQANS